VWLDRGRRIPQLTRIPLDIGAMIILASLLIPLGFLIFMGSLGLERPRSSLVRAWGLAVIAIGLVVLALSALQADPDNPAVGPRLGRPMFAALVALSALAWAILQTVRWARTTRARRADGRASRLTST
jgi:uncharacterized membrane protein YidH (DUF202 family)